MRAFTEKEVSEIVASEAGLRDSGFDVDHECAAQNAGLILEHFEKNPSIPVTAANIYAFVEANKNQFIWRTPAQREYDKVARENPEAAAQLAIWFVSQGKPGQLVNDSSDESFRNSALLLTELRGRTVDTQRIHEAMGRISYRAGRQLHYIPLPPRVDPRQHKDDGEPFLGRDVNLTPAQHRARARAAYASAESESPATIIGREQAVAQHEAETMRGRTHSETDQLQKMFVMNKYRTTEIDWIATRYARNQMQQDFENRHAVNDRRIR